MKVTGALQLQLSLDLIKIREMCHRDLYYLAENVLGNADLYPPLHQKICTILEGIESDSKDYTSVIIPREHFKTTLCSVAYPIWRILRDPNIRILIGHGKRDHAVKVLREIKAHFELNEKLRAIAPDVCWKNPANDAPVWMTDEIVLKRTIHDKVPTIMVTSPDSGMAGLHYHLIIQDDIVNELNCSTPGQRESIKEFRRNADNLLRKGGKVLNVGTRWHWDDAHGELLDKDGPYRDQVRELTMGCWGADGEPIFPTQWSTKRLQDKATRVGARVFSCQYLNDPTPKDTAVFMKDRIQWYDECPPVSELAVFTSVDPNRSEKTQHDPAVVITAGRDVKGHIWVLDMFRGHPTGMQLVDVIRAHVQQHQPVCVFVEANNYQLQLCNWLREDQVKTGTLYNITEVVRSTTSKKFDRISAMAPLVENYALHLRRGMEQIAIEMEFFPSWKNDDCIDALADIYSKGWNYTGPTVIAKPVPKSPWVLRNIIEDMKTSAGIGRAHRG